MAIEIERKFLVSGEGWRQATPRRLAQGYLNRDKYRTVRIRIDENKAFLTVKGITSGASRAEYEYAVPLGDAEQMLAMCDGAIVEKRRHLVEEGGTRWDVDEFLGANEGLLIAEVELDSADQACAKPSWLGEEVTEDPRFFNSNLAERPWCSWALEERQRLG